MVSFSSAADIDVQKQVDQLTKELAYLQKYLRKRGGALYEDSRETASDLYSDLSDRIADMMPVVRKQARAYSKQGLKAANAHPATTAAVGLAVVGLIATLWLSRR